MNLQDQIQSFHDNRPEDGPHPGLKVAAVALVATGMSFEEAGRICRVAPQTVAKWQREIGLSNVVPSAIEDRREDLGEQLYEYLQKSIRTLVSQLDLFGDYDWLSRQKAGDLAVLHGVIADKATRLLAALRPDDRDQLQQDTAEARVIEAEVSSGT